MIGFQNPLFLVLLILPPLLGYFLKQHHQPGAIIYSDTTLCTKAGPTWKVRGLEVLPWLMTIGLILLIIGLARPQIGLKESIIRREGIDIVMVSGCLYQYAGGRF